MREIKLSEIGAYVEGNVSKLVRAVALEAE